MLSWATAFFVMAIISVFLGFGSVAIASTPLAKILFFVFLTISVCIYLLGWQQRIP